MKYALLCLILLLVACGGDRLVTVGCEEFGVYTTQEWKAMFLQGEPPEEAKCKDNAMVRCWDVCGDQQVGGFSTYGDQITCTCTDEDVWAEMAAD